VIDVTTHPDVDRPAAEVFAFVSDHLNAPLWQSGLHEVRRTADGPIGVGTEHVFVRRFAGSVIDVAAGQPTVDTIAERLRQLDT
jgi:hypothetical protein